jgi:hypothetical protein
MVRILHHARSPPIGHQEDCYALALQPQLRPLTRALTYLLLAETQLRCREPAILCSLPRNTGLASLTLDTALAYLGEVDFLDTEKVNAMWDAMAVEEGIEVDMGGKERPRDLAMGRPEEAGSRQHGGEPKR